MLGQVLLNGVIAGGVYALLAIGYSLVYGVLGLINFAHGSVFVVGAFVTLLVVDSLGASIYVAVPIVLLVGAVMGLCIERVAIRPVRGSPQILQLITVLAVAVVIENAVAAIFGSDSRSLPPDLAASSVIHLGTDLRLTEVQGFSVLLAVVLLALVWLVVRRSGIGRAMRAVADDAALAASCGVRIHRVVEATFALGSALGAVAGLVVALDIGCDPYMGLPTGFKAFTACVLGGIGNLSGALAGGLALGILENLVAAYISTEYESAFVMTILVVVLLVRPEGLFGILKVRGA